jgi:hypothetical protein
MLLRRHSHPTKNQRGAALMIMLIILVMGAATMFVVSLNSSALQIARDKTTAAALAQAKDALIGRAVSDDNMPGSLPCPDLLTDIPENVPNDGIADLPSGNDCPSYVGRLPWKTLGLPDLRDGSGERLWYALSANFRDDNSARPLNSNTKGSLLVYRADGLSPQTGAGYNAVAVIFSPGNALGSQTRNTAVEQNSAANYLDIANSRNNASATGPFIAGAKSETFNDQLLFITTRSLMPLVEQRVAGEVKQVLANYYTDSGCNCYPWADSVAQSADYDSNVGLNRGWLPNNALPVNWAGTFRPPQWFFDNEWYKLIYYSVARTRKPPGTCDSCIDDTLRVDGVSGVGALFIMPGTPIGMLIRSPTTLSDYLEDSENYDDNDDRYVTPTSSAIDRDRLYRLP